uniref:Uncharacterized protein n=1 Tax=Oryza nivara TaxID=4536 RepID=A0A0E0GB78_ORYNI
MFPPRERSRRQSSATNRERQGHLERRGSRRRRRRPSARSGRGSPPPSSSPASTPPAAAARPLLHPAPAPRVPLTRINRRRRGCRLTHDDRRRLDEEQRARAAVQVVLEIGTQDKSPGYIPRSNNGKETERSSMSVLREELNMESIWEAEAGETEATSKGHEMLRTTGDLNLVLRKQNPDSQSCGLHHACIYFAYPSKLKKAGGTPELMPTLNQLNVGFNK